MKARIDNKGFALPLLLMVMMVLMLIATTIGELGFGSLRVSTFDRDADQAIFAAESGLVAAAEEFVRTGDLGANFAGQLPNGSSYSVQIFKNDTSDPMTTVQNVRIPPSTVYLHSTGKSLAGRTRESGILMKSGFGFFRVGALGDDFLMANSDFDSFSSNDGDYPTSVVADEMIAVSNTETGDIFNLTDTRVDGGIFVGPGGNPGSSITMSGSTVTRQGTLDEPLEVDEIVIPDVHFADIEGDDPPPSGDQSVTFPGLPNAVIQRVGGELQFNFDAGGGEGFFMTVQTDGEFRFQSDVAFGNVELGQGNLAAGFGSVSGGGGDDSPGQIFFMGPNSFFYTARDGIRTVAVDLDGNIYYDEQSSGSGPAQMSLPSWVFGDGGDGGDSGDAGPPSVTNPDTLPDGEYDTITIDAGQTNLQSGGTYVVDSLHISDGGVLALPAGADEVNIYVRNGLTLEGDGAVLNDTRKAPKLNMFYAGSNDVVMNGGSKAYFTLFAPESDLQLAGDPSNRTEFFGALVGNSISVSNANFHFDQATRGVGQGVAGENFKILAMPRF